MQSKNEVTALYEYNKDESRQLIEKLSCERSLAYFVKKAWKYIDPNPYIHNWHIDNFAAHLEAVTRGEIKRLLINIPPRCAKTSVISICWPAWVWIQSELGNLSGPQVQWLCASYGHTLSLEISTKCRRLIESPWYQGHWGDRVQLTSDQNTKGRFDNTAGGHRFATSVGGTLLGTGANIIVVDDPTNSADANSEVAIENARLWFDEGLATRLNNPREDAIVVIMQRLAETDLSGHILENDEDDAYVHVCYPMEYDPMRHCATEWSEDPRTEAGELLWPERIDEDALSRMKSQMGSFAVSGQFQQLPSPRGGGIIKSDWWQLWPPLDWPPIDEKDGFGVGFEYLIASVDTAYTTKQENDYSACVVLGVFRDMAGLPKAMLIEAWQERLEFHDLIKKIMNTCRRRKVDALLIETKASGISVMQEIQRLCKEGDFTIVPIDPGMLDKVARVYAIQPSFEGKLIYAPDRKYADMVINQFETFPKGKHDDLVDATTNCIWHLRRTGMLLQEREARKEKLEDEMYKSKSIPISQHYGV